MNMVPIKSSAQVVWSLSPVCLCTASAHVRDKTEDRAAQTCQGWQRAGLSINE